MAKTTVSTANINVTTDTFQSWVNKTNELLYALETEIVTANSTIANTGTDIQPRKARINGTFGANTIVAANELRGGNVGDNQGGLLTITSNTVFGGNSTVNATFANCQANLYVNNSIINLNSSTVSINGSVMTIDIVNGLTISANLVQINANTLNLNANTTISRLTVTGNTTFVGEVFFSNASTNFANYTQVCVTNTNIGSDTSNPTLVMSFDKTVYSTAKITSQAVSTAGNTQISEILIAHNGTTPVLTVYGTVLSPSSGEVGDYTANINGANVELKFKQNSTGTSIKLIANLIRQ